MNHARLDVVLVGDGGNNRGRSALHFCNLELQGNQSINQSINQSTIHTEGTGGTDGKTRVLASTAAVGA